jgi:hypothetical protein
VRRAGGWGACSTVVIAAVMSMAACGGTAPSLATGDPLHDLITLDQLVAPDFTVSSPAAHVDASTLAAGDTALATALTSGGLQSAASVEYQRGIDFSTSNGPTDVVATVMRFASITGASSAYNADVKQLDAISGAVPASTGPLGDEGHSISVVRTTAGGLQAVEITVVWRLGKLVNIIITRGRYGGTRLDDALVLAGVQTQNESGSSG